MASHYEIEKIIVRPEIVCKAIPIAAKPKRAPKNQHGTKKNRKRKDR